jgi:hypothetical protein
VLAQFSFTPTSDAIILKDSVNSILELALSGGINAGQFGKIDLDNDGMEELAIFDRYNNTIRVFAKKQNQWQYLPHSPYLFPDDLDGFVLFRDYNRDGLYDIFTSTPFGIKVYQNISSPGVPVRWEIAQDFIRTKTVNGTTNLQVNITDIPGIADIDSDGDLDIFVYNFATGGFIRFHRNLSEEIF